MSNYGHTMTEYSKMSLQRTGSPHSWGKQVLHYNYILKYHSYMCRLHIFNTNEILLFHNICTISWRIV